MDFRDKMLEKVSGRVTKKTTPKTFHVFDQYLDICTVNIQIMEVEVNLKMYDDKKSGLLLNMRRIGFHNLIGDQLYMKLFQVLTVEAMNGGC